MIVSLTKEQRWKLGGSATALVLVLLPLWREFSERDQPVWNGFLFLILVGLLFGALLLHRYLIRNIDEIGEARFDTRNK